MNFQIASDYQPTGDQPQAIDKLVKGINSNERYQTLLGVTGSGKTFTMANLVEKVQKPTLVLAHNKTLAAQLYAEFKSFFQRMQLNISFLIMIITNLKLTFQPQEPISKKIYLLMMKLKSYV